MIVFQKKFNQPTAVMTSEDFARLVISEDVINRIKGYRQQLPEFKQLKQLIKTDEALLAEDPNNESGLHQELKAEMASAQQKAKQISNLKAGLPLIIYQATFDETTSKSGRKAAWRKQSAAHLNGLFMLDIDHIGNGENGQSADPSTMLTPKQMFMGFRDRIEELGILLVHITPSGNGLRIVAKADVNRGNLADNQHWLAQQLGVQIDEACKDASRGSFCPSFEDLLHINKEELFTYSNKVYDEKWGDSYRNPSSSSRQSGSSETSQSANLSTPLPHREGQGGGSSSYHGVPYAVICDKWFQLVLGGQPSVGDRHGSLYRLACDLRYITDFNPVLLKDILSSIPVGQEIIAERGQAEIERIAEDACNQRRNIYLPKRLQEVLAALDIKVASPAQSNALTVQGGEEKGTAPAVIDYEYWFQRLKPFLEDGDPLSEAVKMLPDHHKIGGILAAGCMFGTYLTRTWWHHFDGKDCRLSFLVYIPGTAASGKSFIGDISNLIMAPLIKMDKEGRQAEEKYEAEVKKRNISSKNAKGEAPERPAYNVRVVPSSISNKVLYRRLKNAVDKEVPDENGEPLHLHLYTVESELATALRAQQGSWAGKLDFELKSFHNEYAGVDYADEGSANGLSQVNWNQVVSGTWGAFWKKFKMSDVLDGMATRLCIFPMPDNEFKMIERRDTIVDKACRELLTTIGLKLEQVKGLLEVPRLVDFCYDYEAKLTEEARLEQDHILDYFRKRIPIIMIRYALVRIVTRQLDAILRGEDIVVADDDLEFARLIGDFCLFTQMYVFGHKVEKALELENSNFVPRKRSNKIRFAYAQLPMEGITREMLVEKGFASSLNSASKTLTGWQADGLIVFQGTSFKKLYEEIPL